MVRELLKWWPYHNGHYLLKGIDLIELFNQHDHAQTMDMIDSLIVEDSAYDSRHQGGIMKMRASLNKDYGKIVNEDDSDGSIDVDPDSMLASETHVAASEDNFAGLGLSPLGM